MATGDFMGRTRPSTLNKFAATIPITGISNFLKKAPEACERASDVVVSNSQEQIEQLYDKWKTDNIKKGWNPLNSEADSIASEPETVSAPTKKPAAKKKPATRSTKKKSAVNKSESDAPVKKRATQKKKAK
jgi:hypothetical protein